MTQVIEGPRGAAVPSSLMTGGAARGNKEMGKDEFLKLLITQLRNQDPISPSKPEEFAAQLAQFTSLERMQNIEKLLQAQSAADALGTLALKADLGASFIGRRVLAAGNEFAVTGDGPVAVPVEIGAGGGRATLTVYDASGLEVTRRELGFLGGGRQEIPVADLPAGTYTYRVSATSLAGADVPVRTFTSGLIDGVSFQGGTVQLRSGALTFPLDEVVEVERATAGAAALAAVTSARLSPSPKE